MQVEEHGRLPQEEMRTFKFEERPEHEEHVQEVKQEAAGPSQETSNLVDNENESDRARGEPREESQEQE